MSRKIIGITVGSQLPKPNFKQTDPTKGDYIKNKPDFEGLESRVDQKADLVDGKIPTSQLPDDIGGALSWDDITDKPFGEEGLEIVWDGNPETALEEPFEVPTMGAILYKISNETPSADECVGAYARLQDSEGNEVVLTIDSAQPTDSEDCFVLMGGGYGLFTVALKDGSYNFMDIPFNLTAGVWSVVLSGGYTPLQLGKSVVIKLDEKYLSDTLIKSDMIGVPNGVASLDDNGKVPLEQLPNDVSNNVDLSDYYTKTDTDAKLQKKADLVNGKIPLAQLPDGLGGGEGGTLIQKQVDYNQNDPTQVDYILNRPFYDDRQISRYVQADNPNPVSFDCPPINYTFYKISDLVLSRDEILNSQITVNGEQFEPKESDILTEDSKMISIQVQTENNYRYGFAFINISGELQFTVEGNILSVNVPETGIYFVMQLGRPMLSDAIIEINAGGELKQLDAKYIPSREISWNDLKDKPFYKETILNIEWDGVTDGRDIIELYDEDDGETVYTYCLVKVNDEPIQSMDDITDATMTINYEGIMIDIDDIPPEVCYPISNNAWSVDGAIFNVTVDNEEIEINENYVITFSAGVYFMICYANRDFTAPVYAIAKLTKTYIHTLDPEVVPDMYYDKRQISYYSYEDNPEPAAIHIEEIGYSLYKISDLTPSLSQLFTETQMWQIIGEDSYEFDLSSCEILLQTNELLSVGSNFGLMVAYQSGQVEAPVEEFVLSINVPETGIYFVMQYGSPMLPIDIKIIVGNDFKKIDSKFLPDDVNVDLSDYYTKAEIDASLNNIDLSDYYTKDQINSTLSNYAYNSTLNNYYTSTQVDSKFNNYYTKSQVYTKTEADNNYYTKSAINSTLNNYYTSATINSKFNNYYTTTQVNSKLNDYYTKTEVDTALNNVDLSNYYTKSQVYTKTEADNNYYTKSEIDNIIGSCDSLINDINSIVGGYDT